MDLQKMIFIFSSIYIVSSDFIDDRLCQSYIQNFKQYELPDFESWRIKKSILRFPPYPSAEEMLFSIQRIIKCNYKVIKTFSNLGIEIHTELFDDYGELDIENGYCDPIFVPYASKLSANTNSLEPSLSKLNHTVITHIKHGKYVILYMCREYSLKDNVIGAFVFIDENLDVENMDRSLVKSLQELGLQKFWQFKDFSNGQCMCENQKYYV